MRVIAMLGSVYLSIVGLAVMVHFIVVPLYHPGGDEAYPVWEVLNYLMAVGIVIALVGSGLAKRRHDAGRGSDAVTFISVNAVFYSVLTVGILFFWNWRDLLGGGSGNFLIWNFIDVALPLALFAAGRQLWRTTDKLDSGDGRASESSPAPADHGSSTAVLLRVLAAYAFVVALVVALKFIVDIPWPGWTELDWFMAGGVLIALGSTVAWKVRDEAAGGPNGDVRRFLDVNLPLQVSAALFIAFFFQWFATMTDHEQVMATVGDSTFDLASMWAYIDTAYIVTTGMIARRLWKAAKRSS